MASTQEVVPPKGASPDELLLSQAVNIESTAFHYSGIPDNLSLASYRSDYSEHGSPTSDTVEENSLEVSSLHASDSQLSQQSFKAL